MKDLKNLSTGFCNFGTKADTLNNLRSLVHSATILPLLKLTYKEWDLKQSELIDYILVQEWAKSSLIVRSSACVEDALGASNAGKYRTISNVNGRSQLINAINTVFSSYGTPNDDDQVFIQPMITEIRLSGVASSKDPSTNAPYIIINWTEGSDTCAVTSGRGTRIKTWFGVRGNSVYPPNEDISSIVNLLNELEMIFNNQSLEIEFGFHKNGTLFLFQVRPIVNSNQKVSISLHKRSLQEICITVKNAQSEQPLVLGNRTIFGVMPDWNPAEMIGIHPRPLSLSIYKTLITDDAFSIARKGYGYYDVGKSPLMVDFFGLPYIDIRTSFSSLIPKDLDLNVAKRLVEYYIQKLAQNPSLHDKVEFEVVFSCYSPGLENKLKELHDFSAYETENIISSLRSLTSNIISLKTPWKDDLAHIKYLRQESTSIKFLPIPGSIRQINSLLNLCKYYGTIPFAGLARASFISIEFLNGLVQFGIITEDQKLNYLSSHGNLTSKLVDAFNNLLKDQFLEEYGHLRPGTYDILSPRYDEEPERYFDWTKNLLQPLSDVDVFEMPLYVRRNIDRLLNSMELEFNEKKLLEFMHQSIIGRENAKFEFTRCISNTLQCIKLLGETYNISPDDMSYLDIETIKCLPQGPETKHQIMKAIDSGRKRYEITKSIMLPPVILEPQDIWGFEYPETQPNFVTQKRCIARVADIEKGDSPEGSIAFIKSADPGYDWLFTRNITGLVTAYGGYNSHMAIRAIEFNIPAAIGVGEIRFRNWLSAEIIDLDAGSHCVRTLL